MTMTFLRTHPLPAASLAALVAACIALAPAVRGQTSPGVKEFDRSNAELAASLILDKLKDDVLAAPPGPDVLEAEMETDPGKYVEPDEAKRKLQRQYRDAMDLRYREEAGKYLDRIAGGAGRDGAFAPEFLASALALPSNRLDDAVAAGYPGTFATARANACARQASALIADIKPAEREFDEMPLDRLSAVMTERIAAAQRKPVFVENLEHITRNLVQPILEAAEAQRAAQRTFLERHPVEAWTPGRIGAALEAGLTNFVAESAPRHRVAYGVFPSVAAAVPGIAEGRALDKFARVLEETEPTVDAAAALAEIERSPEQHRAPEDSLEAFAPEMSERLVREGLARCIPLVPAGEASAFDEFAKTALEHERIERTVSNRVVKVLQPQLRTIRGVAARRQMEKLFPALAAAEWFPSPALVDFAGEAVDYRKTVSAWRALPEMASVAQTAQREAMLVETEEELDGAVREAFDRSQRARARQHRIVDDVFEAMRSRLKAEGGTVDLEVAVATYSETVVTVWEGDRTGVLWGGAEIARPSNADRQHAGLFPSTSEKIRLKVKSILESIEKEKNPEKPPEPTPETPPPPPEELERIKLDCQFAFTRKGGEIVVSLIVGGETRGSVACAHEPDAYRRQLGGAVGGAVSALAAELAKHTGEGAGVDLVVDVIVRDDLVYYGIVAKLVEALNAKTPEFAETGVVMKVNESRQE